MEPQDDEITQVTVRYGTIRRLKSIIKDDPRVEVDALDFDSLVNEALTYQKHKYENVRTELSRFQKRILGGE
jgi:hypothetical protein